MSQVVSLLTIDARGAEAGSALYVRSMQAAQAAVDRIRDAEERATAARQRSLGLMTTQADGVSKTARAWDKLRSSVDPIIAQQKQIERAQLAADAAFRRGIATQEEAARVVDLVRARYSGAAMANDNFSTSAANAARQTGLARHELINLGRQVQDIGTQLAMGQSPMQVLASQAAQVADIFMSTQGSIGGFLRQVGGGALRFAMSGAGLATGAATAGGLALLAGSQFADSQRELERSLSGVGRQSGVTAGQVNRMADAYAAAAKTSTAAAREIMAGYAATGRISSSVVFGSGALTRDLAAFQGVGIADAAKHLAQAFVDPTRGAEELNKQIGFLDAKTLDYIRTAQAQGRMGEAQKALSDSLGQSLRGAADRTSGLASAWNSVWNAASRAWDALGRATGGQSTMEDRLASLIEARRQAEGRRSRFGSASALAGFDSGISDLQEQIRRRNQQADLDARTARQNAASTGALSVLDEINPFANELRRLEAMASALRKGLNEAGSALRPDQARDVAEAYERVQRAIEATLPPALRQQQVNDLTIRSINARTLSERTAVEVMRLQQDSAFKLLDTETQRLQVLGKINEMQAQANREARDFLRSARDQAGAAGLRPYERRLREIEIRERDNRERFGGTTASAMPASAAAAGGLDQAFAASLKAMAAAIPGITITSGFRTYEQQAKLYAEKPGWAAPPGRSQHEKGLAADIAYNGSSSIPAWIRDRASEFGLTFPIANRAVRPEPWHVEPMGGRAGRATAARGDAAGEIAGLERAAAATESYNSIIRSANDNLAAQQKQLDATRDTLFMSTEEIARAQKFQELYSQAVQEGGSALASALLPEIQRTAAGYGELARQQELLKASQDTLRSIGDIGKDALKGFISDLRSGRSAAEAFQNTLNRVADKLIDMAINDLFGKAFGGTGGSTGGSLLGLLGRFVGIGGGGGFNFNGTSGGPFSFGAGGYSGAGPYFAEGGYTGHGGKHDPAGIVHRGEYVFDAAATSRIGVHALEGLRRGLPGYAGGGYVAPQPYMPPAANGNAPTQRMPPIVNNVQVVAPPGAQVRQEERRNESGGKDLLVMIDEAVADRLATPGSNLNRAARTTFGMQSALTRR